MVARAGERVDGLGAAARGAGGLDGITAGAVGRDTDGDAAGGGEVPSPSDGNGDESERDARRLARWLETAAAAASAERTGGPGATAAASERLAHALVAVGLLIGRAGLAGGGGESGDARARAALRNRAADALVPALGSRSGAARDLAASVAAATVGWGGWSAEHAVLLDGSLAALDDASESRVSGLGRGRRLAGRGARRGRAARQPGVRRDATRPRARASNVRTRTDRGRGWARSR